MFITLGNLRIEGVVQRCSVKKVFFYRIPLVAASMRRDPLSPFCIKLSSLLGLVKILEETFTNISLQMNFKNFKFAQILIKLRL